jgi:hypothetical protein
MLSEVDNNNKNNLVAHSMQVPTKRPKKVKEIQED